MKLNDAFAGIYKSNYGSLHGGTGGDSRNSINSHNSFLSQEILFKGITEKKKTQDIKNQEVSNYHMYRNAVPWELNKHANQEFNEQHQDNEYRQERYRNQEDLSPMSYDAKAYGTFGTELTLPVPLDCSNDKMFEYHTGTQQGMAHNARMQDAAENLTRQRRSIKSEDEYTNQNSSLQSYFFTPMNGIPLRKPDSFVDPTRPQLTRQAFPKPRQNQPNQQSDQYGQSGQTGQPQRQYH